MKVLHISSGNLFGGVETLLLTLAKKRDLCPQMEPHFALCFEGKISEGLHSLGVPLYLLGRVRISRPWTVWKARRNLNFLLEKEKFDIAICHMCWSQVIFGRTVKSKKIPLVFYVHGILRGKHWLERLTKQIVPDLVIANSFSTAHSVPTVYNNAKTEVVYYPVEFVNIVDKAAVRETVRRELKIPPEATVIIQVSRLEEGKGHSILLSALGELKEMKNWFCLILGGAQRRREERYLDRLRLQAKKLFISERVFFLGERNDVYRLLAAADIFCQPNTSPDAFGISFIEALYVDLPVVSSALGGALEIVTPNCGILCMPSNIESLSNALEKLINNPDERIRLASEGPKRARELCGLKTQINKLYDILFQLRKENTK